MPPLSSTERASGSTSAADEISPRLSRSHWMSAPAIATDPSSAYTGGALPRRYPTVVSRPCQLCTIRSPVLRSMKQPVPYVFFASPGSKQACPNRAACWSPRSPAIGTPARSPTHVPYTSDDERISGRIARGTPMAASSSSSQASDARSISIVRLALVTSVTWTPPVGPPVRFQMHHESIVPTSSRPSSSAARTPGTLSSIQRIFGPAKYVASGSPVRERKRSGPSSRARSATSRSVRVSCQTIALPMGSPVVRSQATVVSRWFVMPMAARSAGETPALANAPRMTSPTRSRISAASCSTQPARG